MPLFGKTPEQQDAERKEREWHERKGQIIKERQRRIRETKQAIADFNAKQTPKFKWEYYRLLLLASGGGTIRYNGQVHDISDLNDIMDELGKRGWELVGVSTSISTTFERSPDYPFTYTSSIEYVFKRPKFPIPEELAQALESAKAYNG